MYTLFRSCFKSLCTAACLAAASNLLLAAERRAPAPDFQPGSPAAKQFDDVFFKSLNAAIEGQRPTVGSLKKAAVAAAVADPAEDDDPDNGSGTWKRLVSAATLEDEVKRVRLRFDSRITTPGAFNSGGYQDARVDLSVLAMLFAVISEYDGDVRWKDESAAARNLIARTASNAKAGSTQVYNEARLRKQDLTDLVSGTGIPEDQNAGENDWSVIADRIPLMNYAEELVERLADQAVSLESTQSNEDTLLRDSELLAMLGSVIIRDGMEEADDEDYQQLSQDMTARSGKVAAALRVSDYAAAEAAVGQLRQACDNCHQEYR